MHVEDVVNQLAAKYGISKGCTAHIIRSQFMLLREVITNEKYETLMLPKLGKFLVKPKRKEVLDEYRRLKRLREQSKLSSKAEINTTGLDKPDMEEASGGTESTGKG